MGHTPRHGLCAALVLSALATAVPAAAQIRINEILPDPTGDDATFERVEIYNAGSTLIDVTGWCIQDAATIDGNPTPERYRLPEDFATDAGCSTSPIILPGEFRVLKYRTPGASGILNNTGDDLYLCTTRTIPPAAIVHQVSYGSTTGRIDQVWAALPNGTENFDWRSNTMCATNGSVGDATAPGAVTDLAAAPGLHPGEIRLTWTAPGDDGATGTATAYTIKVAFSPVTGGTFDAAADLDRWLVEPLPHAAGTPETLYVFGFHPDSTYHFALVTQDEMPNNSAISNGAGTAPLPGFRLNPDLGYTPYFGNLHSHTGYSDGVSTPPAAYDFARFTAPTPLDFLAVTDHNHVSAGMSYPNYALGMAAAADKNEDGQFVAIWGQEWGLAANGHVNIFEAPGLFGWDAGQYDVFTPEGDYPALYAAAAANPPASYPVLLEWCHPQSGDFDNMVVTPEGLASVHLIALVNGPSTSTSTTESDVGNTGFDNELQDALRKGYRVSPTGDQDNHQPTWGASSESRTAVLAGGLTKSEVMNGLAARRSYATQDHNVVVRFSAESRPMGAAFPYPTGIRLAVDVTDPDPGDRVAEIDVYRGITGSSNAVIVASSTDNSHFEWRDTQSFAAGVEAHYYLRIRMADNQLVWTGPVYVTYDPSAALAVRDRTPAERPTLSATPYPAFGRVTASFALARDERRAELVVYDATGPRVATLLDGPLAAGRHQIAWAGTGDDGRAAPAGLFFLRLRTEQGEASGKALLIR
jgi:hypothetical protein